MRMLCYSMVLVLWSNGAFGQNAFGPAIAPGAALAPAKGEMPALPYEPWVESAKVGDYIVMRYPNGLVQRKEVKEVTLETVVTELSNTYQGKVNTSTTKVSRDRKTAQVIQEVEVVQGPTGTLAVNGKSLTCHSISGSIVTGSARTNNQALTTKLTRFQRVTSPEVPFGGVVKYFQAPHDGKSMPADSKKPGVVIRNGIDKVELVYEVTEFGRGQ